MSGRFATVGFLPHASWCVGFVMLKTRVRSIALSWHDAHTIPPDAFLKETIEQGKSFSTLVSHEDCVCETATTRPELSSGKTEMWKESEECDGLRETSGWTAFWWPYGREGYPDRIISNYPSSRCKRCPAGPSVFQLLVIWGHSLSASVRFLSSALQDGFHASQCRLTKRVRRECEDLRANLSITWNWMAADCPTTRQLSSEAFRMWKRLLEMRSIIGVLGGTQGRKEGTSKLIKEKMLWSASLHTCVGLKRSWVPRVRHRLLQKMASQWYTKSIFDGRRSPTCCALACATYSVR